VVTGVDLEQRVDKGGGQGGSQNGGKVGGHGDRQVGEPEPE
jgi:hypothetical protein